MFRPPLFQKSVARPIPSRNKADWGDYYTSLNAKLGEIRVFSDRAGKRFRILPEYDLKLLRT